MTTLIIGGTGFIGRAIADELRARDRSARVMSRSVPESPLGDDVSHTVGDVTTGEGLAEALVDCDGLVFVAGREDLPLLPPGDRDGDAMFEANVRGTSRTLVAAREAGVRQAVVITSCTAYGMVGDGERLDGEEPVGVIGLRNPYVLSRVQQELAALETARPDFRVTCAAPTAVVGAGDDKFFGPLVHAIARRAFPVAPRGGFNFIPAGDVAVGVANLLGGAGVRPRYLFAGENMTYKALIEIVSEQLDQAPPRRVIEPGLLRAASHGITLMGLATGRTLGMTAANISDRLNRHVYYDPRLAVTELDLPQSPVREAIAEAVRSMQLT
ncbi:MAG: NAD-dependent epimerase/dehydratase family protein [Polyangiaceae bacterium]|nr:NAD-dependent epimerase/dehydratase family protein [Polyangiaceae bacterium]